MVLYTNGIAKSAKVLPYPKPSQQPPRVLVRTGFSFYTFYPVIAIARAAVLVSTLFTPFASSFRITLFLGKNHHTAPQFPPY